MSYVNSYSTLNQQHTWTKYNPHGRPHHNLIHDIPQPNPLPLSLLCFCHLLAPLALLLTTPWYWTPSYSSIISTNCARQMYFYLVPYPSRGLTSSLEVVLLRDLDLQLPLPTEYPGFFSQVVFARVSPSPLCPNPVLIKASPGVCVWSTQVDPKGLAGTLALMAWNPSYNRSLFYTILHPNFSVRTLPGPVTCPPILSMHGVTTCVGCSMVSQLQLP